MNCQNSMSEGSIVMCAQEVGLSELDLAAWRYVAGEMTEGERAAFEVGFGDFAVCEAVARQTELLVAVREACLPTGVVRPGGVMMPVSVSASTPVKSGVKLSRWVLVGGVSVLWLGLSADLLSRRESVDSTQRGLLAKSWVAASDLVDPEESVALEDEEGMLVAVSSFEVESDGEEMDSLEVPDWLCSAMIGRGNLPE